MGLIELIKNFFNKDASAKTNEMWLILTWSDINNEPDNSYQYEATQGTSMAEVTEHAINEGWIDRGKAVLVISPY